MEDHDRLPAAAGIAEEHPRLWWRMVGLCRTIAPDLVTSVGGRKILWTSLEDGDETAIGPYPLRIGVGRWVPQAREDTTPGGVPVWSSHSFPTPASVS